MENKSDGVNGRGSAGKEEKTIERGDFHEGVPAITVIVDGGWSKRSRTMRNPELRSLLGKRQESYYT